ncbi:atypical/HisK protein kinase [Amanita muscaria]
MHNSIPSDRTDSPSYHPALFLQVPLTSTHALQAPRCKRKLSRPSTAPEKEDSLLLPSYSAMKEVIIMNDLDASFRTAQSELPTGRPDLLLRSSSQRDGLTGNLSLGSLPPPYDFMVEHSNSALHDQGGSTNGHTGCDWATFITAYAFGRWDPHRTPTPPRSVLHHVNHSRILPSSAPTLPSFDSITASTSPEIRSEYSTFSSTQSALDQAADEMAPSSSSTNLLSLPSNFPFPRSRNSFSTSPASTPAIDSSCSFYSNTDVQTTVATMRWAAARVDISPLALPSPEHELTDPMRGITATIPGSHPEVDDIAQTDFPTTPGNARKNRLGSFWKGTTDVGGGEVVASGQSRLVPILRSPTQEQGLNAVPTFDKTPSEALSPCDLHLPLSSCSGPDGGSVTGEYPEFLSVSPQQELLSNDDVSPSELPSDSSNVTIQSPIAPPSSLSSHVGTASELAVPDIPRRVHLTRQTSFPLPSANAHDIRMPGGRVASDNFTGRTGRTMKEEQLYIEFGYLVPPNPPDEMNRRRALYKFNIWRTGPDVNFDRIAHLVKLVFNTKGSYISLVDGQEQWFKSGWGTMADSYSRTRAFCAHTILQGGDEPMVVLDARLDWRFAKNPLVAEAPHIRFYAGAPLRTQDGFNIGTLAIIDDSPRDDFTPRQRHTLKEFAAIVMREMELWRDKIQLRIRDRIQSSMEQFSRECLEIDEEHMGQNKDRRPDLFACPSMDRVYDSAAKLVKRTLDVEGVIVMDISHSEVLESMNTEGTISVTMHHGEPEKEMTRRQLGAEDYKRLNHFFNKHPEGKVSEGIVPHSFRPLLPTHIQYALTVPIFNIDKRPFALICAYNTSDQSKRFLEGHELSYLRAIGVIILSAVLKRRMILADKAKSLFISNISHELRTPLHGILAAAELLSDSPLNHSQASFLQTVQACGTSLVETVNHVLDFTKLSGNSKAGGVENVIAPSNVDLLQLVEDAVDGCWVGHRARTVIMGDSGIGSVYSPPKENSGSSITSRTNFVETVVDIGYRREGWLLKCEKGGIRRILMNLFGNSLKFTTDGFVHVQLRQLPLAPDDPQDKVKVELSVMDSGKGISQNFLKNQLFHPFSQENPLQTGTGLGLAIVSSIVSSESVNGKIDVRSEEGAGTEIRVTFLAGKPDGNENPSVDMALFSQEAESLSRPTISLVGFDTPTGHKGVQLQRNLLLAYLKTWWNFKIVSPEYGDVVIVNEDSTPVKTATEEHNTHHSFIIMSAARVIPTLMATASDYERIGGFCRILYKPGGPTRLWTTLKLALHNIKIGSRSRCTSADGNMENGLLHSTSMSVMIEQNCGVPKSGSLFRRKSEDYKDRHPRSLARRPSMTPRTPTNFMTSTWNRASSYMERGRSQEEVPPTINIGTGGTLLRASIGSSGKLQRQYRVLVVEDNNILRNLLIKWLSKKGYNYREAVDGRDGVTAFKEHGPFDVVLLDLSMPVLDGEFLLSS